MKVLDDSGKGVQPGSTVSLEELGLPVSGHRAALVVFWKRL